MRRVTVLGTVVFAGAMSMVAAAVQQPAGGGAQQDKPRVVEVEKLRDNLFVLRAEEAIPRSSSRTTV